MAESGGDQKDLSALKQEILSEVRDEGIKAFAKYTIAGVVVLIVAAGAGWVLYLKSKIPDWVDIVPGGAVVAFDLSDKCPIGWTPFDEASSRVIIGSGQGDSLTKRPFRVIGGNEVHQITNDELPPLHIVYTRAGPNGDKFTVGGGKADAIGTSPTPIDFGGSSKAIEHLPPYISLRYCKKN